jgi:hypothetical protein
MSRVAIKRYEESLIGNFLNTSSAVDMKLSAIGTYRHGTLNQSSTTAILKPIGLTASATALLTRRRQI